jgi:hypothetical protein
MHILYRFHGWLIFARVIALFMFVWPYVRSHILCTQLVICLLSHFIDIWYLGWPWSEPKMCERTYGQTNMKRAITLAKINHLWNRYNMRMLRSWPTKIPNINIIPISRMVDLCESYSPFHVCLTICPFTHLVYATSHLSFVAFYWYLVSWLTMIWACAYHTDFTDGWSNKHEKGYNSRKNQPSVKSV